MAAEIRLFPCLSDNFGYLIHDPRTKATASIDAPEAGPIIEALERENWRLTDILITHHHGDHVGGVAELKQKYKARVVAPHDKSANIANVDVRRRHAVLDRLREGIRGQLSHDVGVAAQAARLARRLQALLRA